MDGTKTVVNFKVVCVYYQHVVCVFGFVVFIVGAAGQPGSSCSENEGKKKHPFLLPLPCLTAAPGGREHSFSRVQ